MTTNFLCGTRTAASRYGPVMRGLTHGKRRRGGGIFSRGRGTMRLTLARHAGFSLTRSGRRGRREPVTGNGP